MYHPYVNFCCSALPITCVYWVAYTSQYPPVVTSCNAECSYVFHGQPCIIESVDSICRDSADA